MYQFDVDLHQKQFDIFTDRSQVNVVVAGRSFGKTALLQYLTLLSALTWNTPYTLKHVEKWVVVSMETQTQCKLLHWIPIKRLTESLPSYLVEDINNSDLSIRFTGNRPGIILRGEDNEGERLRGLSPVAWMRDEVQDTKRIVFDEVMLPALMRNAGWRTTQIGTPNGKGTPFHKMFLEAQSTPNWSAHHYTSYDNPFNPVDELDKLRLVLPPSTFNQEIMASWEETQGLILNAFTSHNVSTSRPNEFRLIGVSLDWGEVNPAVVAWGVAEDYSIYVLDTWHNTTGEAITEAQFFKVILELVNQWHPGFVFAPDDRPAQIEALKVYGAQNSSLSLVNTTTVKRNNPSPTYRYALLNTLLHQKVLKLWTENTHHTALAEEFANFKRKRDKHTNTWMDEPDKASGNGVHLTDALSTGLAQLLISVPQLAVQYSLSE